ncbi:LamG domain-containing protein, partial [Aquiflexum sp. TKW24L]|uniref:LamG domain-containing protein n=1 Tax=Aquiflexum sp. TKW24L TaxID=2942212 RepID=UPI0020C0825C
NGSTNRFALVPHNPTLEIPNGLSIAAWVKPNVLHRGTILNKSDGNGFEFWLDNNGQLEFRLNRGTNGNTYLIRSNYNYSGDLGKWIHVAATFNGTEIIIYVNGVANITKTYAPFTIGTTSGNLILGALGTVQRFNGGLD